MSHSICKNILTTLVTIGFGLAYADEGRKLPTIGLIFGADSSTAKPYEEEARAGLRDLGYVDGAKVTILPRYVNGNASRVRPLLRELIALPVDVLFASPKVVRAAKEATRAIPIALSSWAGDDAMAGWTPQQPRATAVIASRPRSSPTACGSTSASA